MSSERAFERERDWTQGPAKWAAVVVLGAACMLTSAWVMAGRVHFEREPAGAQVTQSASALGAPPPLPSRDVAAPAGAAAIVSVEPLGPAPEPSPELVVSVVETTADAAPSTDDASSVARRVNINTATVPELELLPGVGPKLAERIIDHRKKHGPFKNVDDLDAVSGIGARILERLKPLVTVD